MKKLIGFILVVLLSTACIKQRQESCSDGIKNQNEALVDCGGVCKRCPDCFDGVKNQDEENVDCGGPCEVCETCSDGIKNQNETSIDCGGVCPPCPTCNDGSKNQNETGIDCGGPCEPCSTTACSTPLGFGENGYLPNGNAAISAMHDPFDPGEENEDNFKFIIRAEFPLFYPCRAYVITLYRLDFLKLDKNATQVFTITDYSSGSNLPNSCAVEVWMPMGYLYVKSTQKLYVTRVDNGTFNLRFCNLLTHPSNTYNLNTSFSTNVNFTL
ncbi:MAG: hypothetical protein V4635_08550 [Bacteroidota bacterium]